MYIIDELKKWKTNKIFMEPVKRFATIILWVNKSLDGTLVLTYFPVLVSTLLVFFTAACSKDLEDINGISVSSITLNITSATIDIGDIVVLTANITPNNATSPEITWLSTNPGIASVSDGRVQAISAGSTNIIAKCCGVQAQCAITVNSAGMSPVNIELSESSFTLFIGESIELTATVSPEEAVNKDVTWSSTNSNIASVTNGKVTAIAPGTASIIAKTHNGLSALCSIVVIEKVPQGSSEGTGEEEW